MDRPRLFGFEFLQFNGADTNGQAGVLTGYNSITSFPPFNRSELFQAWPCQGNRRVGSCMAIPRSDVMNSPSAASRTHHCIWWIVSAKVDDCSSITRRDSAFGSA